MGGPPEVVVSESHVTALEQGSDTNLPTQLLPRPVHLLSLKDWAIETCSETASEGGEVFLATLGCRSGSLEAEPEAGT